MTETMAEKNYKILIVDDQQKNIQVLGSLLRQESYIIGVATDGKQALRTLLKSKDYDLVLLDVNMPGMNGFEVCKTIRNHENLHEIPIIFLTAMVESESIVRGFESGGQDYVTKPFNSQELLSRVKTHLELKSSRDKLSQVNEWLEDKVLEKTRELQAVNGQLIQLDSAKSEFLNIISHEIRTPLNGIVGILDILNELELPEGINDLLEILELSANRLEEFSAKALDISLFNTKGKDALTPKVVDIYKILSQIISTKEKQADQKNINITLQDISNTTILMVDAIFIEKCFSYILDNAIKFGKINSQIFIQITSSGNNLLVAFQDEGEALPEGYDIASIKPFGTKSHVDENPALSLFLCKQIMDAHTGQIDLKNTNDGVIVTLTIPNSTLSD